LGVGLAGMRERVHQLGGTMEISSSGEGTVVSVKIPARQSQAAVTEQRKTSPVPAQTPQASQQKAATTGL
jgi:signal transduction histidine kinase